MVKVTFTDGEKEFVSEMGEAELRIVLELQPQVFAEGDDYKVESYLFDIETGRFRVYIEKI